jgi:hypothetical protein
METVSVARCHRRSLYVRYAAMLHRVGLVDSLGSVINMAGTGEGPSGSGTIRFITREPY